MIFEISETYDSILENNLLMYYLIKYYLIIKERKNISHKITIVNAVVTRYCDFLLTYTVYGTIVILDHQNIGVEIKFSVYHVWFRGYDTKIPNLIMAESKMAAMETTRCFCDGCISENV